MRARLVHLLLAGFCGMPVGAVVAEESNDIVFRAGAAAVDITPTQFPVIVNGMVEERTATMAYDPLMVRAIVADDGTQRIAIAVVDNLMLTRAMLDDVKDQASQLTGIPTDRMLISATHAHSAPSAMPCLGSRVDPEYAQFLPGQIVRCIVQANEKLIPAKVGWAVVKDDVRNNCRRWIFRSDRMQTTDPFGQLTVRAHMHPGYQSPNHIGPSGPADTDLTVLSIKTLDDKPLAMLANYAMHYYGSPLISGDVCGRFGLKFAELIGVSDQQPGFVGILSQGTSGDSMWMDYSQPARPNDFDAYVLGLAEGAVRAYQSIQHRADISVAMAETTLPLQRRTPDAARLKWAHELVAQVGDRLPRGWSEVYAFEQLRLHEDPTAELKLQAIRIGDFGITAIPDEVYGITGIKLKNRSPLAGTMNIELANGAEGYIPPPEQHKLGGYTTWPARTAGLEVQAEPQIVETLTQLLERVAEKPRRSGPEPQHEFSRAVLESKPRAFWRLGEIDGLTAMDAVGENHGTYEDGIAFYLPGPKGRGFEQLPRGNRAAHFTGGRVVSELPEPGDTYSLECWVWNGLPNDARAVTGYFFSRGPDADAEARGDHLGIGGSHANQDAQGKLLLFNGNQSNTTLSGRTVLEPRTWHHVVFVREKRRVAVYLDGDVQPEITGDLEPTYGSTGDKIFLGGRTDRLFGLEGRLDEVALYDRALTSTEAAAHFAAAGALMIPQISETTPQPTTPPLSPAESMKVAHVRDGFELQLIAAEPLVIDPVAIDWGPDGRLWVAEMADYPSGMDDKGKPGGRIRFLEDTNNDGQYETSTVLLQDIPFPTGVMAWGNGVIVTAAPEIFYAEDSDGDGKADVRRTLFSGFRQGNQQLRVNGPRWGLDNWIHCASGSHHAGYGADSQILSHITNQKINVGSRDFRFRPDSGLLDPQSGPSQFGRNRDRWGNWFGEQNSYPLWHYVLEDQYIRRNPHFAPPDPRHLMTPSNPPVYGAAPPEKRFHSFEQSGRYTSACSGMVYLDDLLFGSGNKAASNDIAVQHVFTCEPFSNLVQHNLLIDDGVSFRLERDPAEFDKKDFFASEDRWCRPVMVRTGPDGALWIVDMYRYMIEHPQWLPKEGQDELRPFFRSGDDRGRIYRIVPRGSDEKRDLEHVRIPLPTVRMDQMSPPQLVAELESTNGWRRDTAQRLLVTSRDESTIAALSTMVTEGKQSTARLHALCTLEGLGKLSKEIVACALQDPHPGVRRWAVRIAPTANVPVTSLSELTQDTSAKVRLELACIVGQYHEATNILSDLLLSDPDPWLQAAVMSSLNIENISVTIDEFSRVVRNDASANDPSVSKMAGFTAADRDELTSILFGQAASMVSPDDLRKILMLTVDAPHGQLLAWQLKSLAVMLDHLDARSWSVADQFVDEKQQESLAAAFEFARKAASAPLAHETLRCAAIPLLLRGPAATGDEQILRELLMPQTPVAVQEVAIQHLGRQTQVSAADILLAGWSSHSPSIRAQILTILSSRPQWVAHLVKELESGAIAAGEIDAAMRQRLLTTRDADLRQRIESVFTSGTSDDRKMVMESYRPALQFTGNAERGAVLFGKKCSTCHKQGGIGHEVGPNLASLTTRTPESLYSAILDPSAAVETKYLNFVVATKSGRSVVGLLSTETGSSITVLGADGKSESILRTEIEELRSTGKSLMPDGIEKDFTQQDLADVIEFVRTLSDR